MGGKERPKGTSEFVETRTQREIILDTLRQKFPEWGYDPRVPDWIIDFGIAGLVKGANKKIIGFGLEFSKFSDDGTTKDEVNLRYNHPQKTATIFTKHENHKEVCEGDWLGTKWEGKRLRLKIQDIEDIGLKDTLGGEVLAIKGKAHGGDTEFFCLSRKGVVIRYPVSCFK